MFKGIDVREGGEFTNERGQVIQYDPAYRVMLDEITGSKATTRTFTFPINNKELESKFKNLHLYDSVIVAFDIAISRNNAKLVPFDVICEKGE